MPARAIQQELSQETGQNWIIESKPGAGGAIGTSFVSKAAPDGKTLLMAASSHFVTSAMGARPFYEPVKEFAPVANIGNQSYVLMVNAGVPAKTAAEFIQYAKSKPGVLNYNSAGVGSSTHLAMAYFAKTADLDIVHVPYKNINQGFTDLIAGTVSMTFYHVPVIYPHVKEGRLRALGVATSERSPIAPEVPPISDTVKGYDLRPWWGLAGPAGIPKDITDKLYAATTQVLADPDVRERFKNLGLIITPMTTQQFNDFTVTELAKWSKIVKDSGASVN
jgi:tripartite-type tricarboxylate transporter receptor subunit TctC